ncbi:MAG: DEAD/DEAH box helicase family protein [Brevinematales bacterium]|nr:DEAD/DEAH box helicase family protein [Brevinematales bacterium]
MNNLNEFLGSYKKNKNIDIDNFTKNDFKFTKNDLKKLAFWMATGSGKTLIMHINYYQFLEYKLFSPDNIILITPNEGLSRQHFEELQKSGIQCRLYGGSLNGGIKWDNEVLVIEITKIVEEKKGGGLTIQVDAFEGKNLVFVDEGHKGRKSEDQKWAKLRNQLAKDGFVFEYSATFGQILSEDDKKTLQEYAKSIIFDYSYKYFYLDGYGKDFSVLNVAKSNNIDNFQEVMFVANLLSFYEQVLVYEENKHLAKEYNLEKPLWIFVGTTVTGKEEESDVIQIVEFINRVIKEKELVKKWIDNIIDGGTGLKDEEGEDVFRDKFRYLRKREINLDDIYKKVFGGTGVLGLYELKNAEGEIGLKVGENDYFGVINIGNVSAFKRQLEVRGITVSQDVISGSLFDKIKEEDSKINILIGSKKFIEGWDTWRVSSMGLLNIGTGQGPQIIQLFGRGVRLKGKNMSLKRSGASPEIQILETLNIYGIKADYLNKFLDAIRKEDVEFETIKIPIYPQYKCKWCSLYILSKPEKDFAEEKVLRLEISKEIHCTVDLLPKVSLHQSGREEKPNIEAGSVEVEAQDMRPKLQSLIDLLDWEHIWQEIIEFKNQRNYWNLIFTEEDIKNLLSSDKYKIFATPEAFNIKNYEDIRRVEDIALIVIKKYIDLFYQKNAKMFETENLRCENMKELPFPNKSRSYIVQVDRKKDELIQELKNLAKNLNKLLQESETGNLPRIYFDKSLYVPLLIQNKSIDKISPQGLVESEKNFIKGLRDYIKNHKDEFKNIEIYLLRNYPFSGVGFQLRWAKFYPDFIMWIKEGKKQTIVFVDPKGLEHTKDLNNEKIQFSKDIKELEKKLNQNVILESFILSQTPHNKLEYGTKFLPSKDKYIENHVLFLEDEDWVEKFFELLDLDKTNTYNTKV